MLKLLLSLGLVAAMVLSAGVTFGAEETKPKKGKFGEKFDKFKDKFGKFGGKLDDEKREKLFEKMDADGDGKVSKEEFKKLSENAGQGKHGEFSDRVFDRLDANSDGYLSKEEFKKFGSGLSGGLGGLKDKFKGKFGKKKGEKKDDQ
jgi:EF hand